MNVPPTARPDRSPSTPPEQDWPRAEPPAPSLDSAAEGIAERSYAYLEQRCAETERRYHDAATGSLAERQAITVARFSEQVGQSVRAQLDQIPSITALENQAIAHWVAYKVATGDPIGTVPSRDQVDLDTLYRWILNYARHQLSTYDTLLERLPGELGRDAAYAAMRETIAAEVTAFYSRAPQ